MKTIYLIRHAHSPFSNDELLRPLSEAGLIKRRIITQLLGDKKIERILSSPYYRAIQTIEPLSQQLNLQIEIDNRLVERNLSMEPLADFMSHWLALWKDFSYHLPMGESNLHAEKRIMGLIQTLLESKENVIAISTHGTLITLLLHAYDSKYDEKFWQNMSTPDLYCLQFENQNLIEIKRGIE